MESNKAPWVLAQVRMLRAQRGPAGNGEATVDAKALFASTMAVKMDMDLESHDRIIAYILGLAPALNIAFFTALVESGEYAARVAEVSTTTLNAQLELACLVDAENPHL